MIWNCQNVRWANSGSTISFFMMTDHLSVSSKAIKIVYSLTNGASVYKKKCGRWRVAVDRWWGVGGNWGGGVTGGGGCLGGGEVTGWDCQLVVEVGRVIDVMIGEMGGNGCRLFCKLVILWKMFPKFTKNIFRTL